MSGIAGEKMGINSTVNMGKMDLKVLDLQAEREHFHQEIQLIYLLEGSMELKVAGQDFRLERDDIIVVNAEKKHSHRASSDVLYCEISISYQIIMEAFGNSDVIFWCNSTVDKNESYDKLREIIRNLLNRYLLREESAADFGRMGLFYYLLEVLSMNFVVRPDDRIRKNHEDKFNERIDQINSYIRNNYNQPITLKDLSEQLYLSNAYLSRFFKKNYGMNFAEYLTNIRLFHAVDGLLYTDYPITKIALDNGFSNVAVFNKIFKTVYGEPPSVFRRKSKKAAVPDADEKREAREKLERYLSENGAEKIEEHTGSSETAEITVRERRPYKAIWNRMINIGPAEDLLNSEMQEHIMLLKEALNFEYVRFWNIFSPRLLIRVDDENQEYNFSKLDAIIDFLIRCGVKPFIELGQKPKRVQRSVKSILIYDEEPPVFTKLSQWESVLREMMRHMIMRYGRAEVAAWKFEMWYDSRMGRQEEGDKVPYFEVFNKGYEVIKKLLPEVEVGGCGSRTTFRMEEFKAIVSEWKKQKYMPDFFSLLCYAYIEGEEEKESFSKRSTDTDFLANVIDQTRGELERQDFMVKKLYVTEWNLTISERNYINDSCYKGAYIVKNIIDNLDRADMVGYFVGSDRFSEYYDSNQLLHGGTGLFTRDGIMKPAGFAFDFLNEMYPLLIARGKNYMVTTNGHDAYGFVCHNYKRLNYYYYLTEEDEISREKIWQYFEDRDSMDLDLNLTDLEEGEYQIKIQRINEEYGSILNEWSDMGFYKELSRQDIKYLRRVSEPKRTISNIKVENGRANIHIRMAANEIALVKLGKML